MRIHLLPESQTLLEPCSDGLLLLDVGTVRYTFLDRTGARMWQALRQTSDVDEAVEYLHGVLAADRLVLRNDLLDFSEHLIAEGLAARTEYGSSPQATQGRGSEATEDLTSQTSLVEPAGCSTRGEGGDETSGLRRRLTCIEGLLRTAVRDGVTGGVVLLGAPLEAAASGRELNLGDAGGDRWVHVDMAFESGCDDKQFDLSLPLRLLWIHTTDAESLTEELHGWPARVTPGGYVFVSGLEPHSLRDAVTRLLPDRGRYPGVVPVDWYAGWWQA